mmetsp:Transcript_9148/g.23916  ORF Transcript_9148/g.23916 Transcript_9148/m.23916 type:complete len:200 (+) Transcript_9148:1289-1888(+)
MVGTKQIAVIFHPALGQGSLTVGTRVLEHAPLPHLLLAVHRGPIVPNYDVDAEQLRLVRAARIHDIGDVHRVPGLLPLELLRDLCPRLLLIRGHFCFVEVDARRCYLDLRCDALHDGDAGVALRRLAVVGPRPRGHSGLRPSRCGIDADDAASPLAQTPPPPNGQSRHGRCRDRQTEAGVSLWRSLAHSGRGGRVCNDA